MFETHGTVLMVGWTSILCQLSWSWTRVGEIWPILIWSILSPKALYRTAAHRTCSPSALLVEGPDEAGFKVAAALGGHGWFSQEFQEEFQEERCFQGFPTCFHHEDMGVFEDLWSGPPSGSGWFEKILGGSRGSKRRRMTVSIKDGRGETTKSLSNPAVKKRAVLPNSACTSLGIQTIPNIVAKLGS